MSIYKLLKFYYSLKKKLFDSSGDNFVLNVFVSNWLYYLFNINNINIIFYMIKIRLNCIYIKTTWFNYNFINSNENLLLRLLFILFFWIRLRILNFRLFFNKNLEK